MGLMTGDHALTAHSDLQLPAWSMVTERRRGHIGRVTALLDAWAATMDIPADERQCWTDAGRWHDALRDAPEAELRALADLPEYTPSMLHGPAAAVMLERHGERRHAVLDAVRYHTIGNGRWERTGKALYMADFLEPGRGFARRDRAFLADHVPVDFEGVFRQVVRVRLEWSLREGNFLFPETVAMWNEIR
jgi:HD superfamily phosphohydrolase YqeK